MGKHECRKFTYTINVLKKKTICFGYNRKHDWIFSLQRKNVYPGIYYIYFTSTKKMKFHDDFCVSQNYKYFSPIFLVACDQDDDKKDTIKTKT